MSNVNPFNPGYYNETELREFGFKSIGKNTLVAKNCTIIGLEHISIGSHTRIDGNTTIVAGEAGLNIGHYVHIAGGCHMAGRCGIDMHDFTGLSQGGRIYSTTDDFSGGYFTGPTLPSELTNVKEGRVVFERHVVVGSGSIVLPGVTIGEGTTVGALSVIRKSTKAWKVYVGNPAKILINRDVVDPSGELKKRLLAET